MDKRLVGSWRLMSLRMKTEKIPAKSLNLGEISPRTASPHARRAVDRRHDGRQPLVTLD